MESRVFFKMLTESRKLSALEYIDLTRIQEVSILSVEYGDKLIEHFKERMPKDLQELERIKEASEAVLEGQNAQSALRSMFSK